MSWTDYKTPTVEIDLGGGKKGELRGLNLEDFGLLVANHLEMLSKAVEQYANSRSDVFTAASLQAFFVTLCQDFPGLATEVISIAADTPELKDKKIALGVQMTALAEIAQLTVKDAGGLGNLLAMIGAALQSRLGDKYGSSLIKLKEHLSQGTIGEFEKTLAS